MPEGYAEPIRLSVAEIQIIPIYVPPRRDPHVDHLFTRPPLAAAEAWARSHLKAVGISHRATVIIREAGVTEAKIEKKGGLSGLFTREPSEKYDAHLSVVIEVRDNYDRFVGRANALVERTQTVLEDTEPDERQEIWSKMTDDMIDDLDREISKQIRQHLAVFVE
ncbi:MAG: hypothetical protein QNJ94_12885 [Alphaproteobacteria bacterium]|nr:hypothetical protein [Alphaproteobacteria bacterium]